MTMVRASLRVAVSFAVVGVLFGGFAIVILPKLLGWHEATCMNLRVTPAACEVAAATLSYWWMAFVPLLVIAAGIALQAPRRRVTD